MEDMMTGNIETVCPQDSLKKAAVIFRSSRLPAIPVINGLGQLIGLFTRSNFLDVLLNGGSLETTVDGNYTLDVMNVASKEISYDEVVAIARASSAGVGVVVDDNLEVQGLFTKVDLIFALLRQLEKETASLEAIYGAIEHGLISLDENFKVKVFNPAAEKILGVKSSAVIKKHISHVIKDQKLLRALESREKVNSLKCIFGSTVALVNCAPIWESEKLRGITLIFQDITEVERVALELESIKRLYQIMGIILDTAYAGILAVDENGKVLLVNKSYTDFFGIKQNILDKHFATVNKESDLLQVISSGVPQINVLELNRNLPYVVSRLPVIKDGKIMGAVEKIIFKNANQLADLVNQIKSLGKQVNYYREELKKFKEQKCSYSINDIIGVSSSVCDLKNEASLAARSSSTVLICGESGTGKELFAHAIHDMSPRRDKPFIKVNCSAIPENLLETEFFGYSPGAFTGASKHGKPGRFELAHGGTLFLDEIGDMPASLQSKLLRVLQDRSFERVGGITTVRVDVRIIAATNKDLGQKVREGSFRADLYYRLNVIQLKILGLRERPEDIVPLANHFVRKYNCVMGTNIEGLSDGTIRTFLNYAWPGNVRELENTIERAMNFTSRGKIEKEHLPESMISDCGLPKDNYPAAADLVQEQKEKPYQKCVESAEKEAILTALQAAHGNKTRAARILGLSRSWLYEKITRLGIES